MKKIKVIQYLKRQATKQLKNNNVADYQYIKNCIYTLEGLQNEKTK